MVRFISDTSNIPKLITRFAFLPITPLSVRALLLLPVAVYFVYFFALRYNIPWFDEYENIPYFLDRFLNARTFGEGMAALLRPNNEHRVLYARLVVLSQYGLTGGLNFANLMLWGNLSLVVVLFLLYRALRKHENSTHLALMGLLPVPLILFTAQDYLLTFTAIYTLQYLAIIMLVMATFFLLATDRLPNFGMALALGILSTFSMGNGLLLWPAGAGMLLIQRRWPALGVWLVVGATSGYLYFLGYPVQQGNAEGFAYLVQHPLKTLAGFFIFAGSVFDLYPALPVEKRVILPFVAGLVVIGGIGYWLVRTTFRKVRNTSFLDAFLFACLLFLLANIGLIALFRLRFYFEIVFHSTYRIYSLVLWSVAVVLLFSRLSESARLRFWPGLWLVFLGVNVLTYVTYLPEAVERRKHMQGLTFNQAYSDIGLGGTRNSDLARYIADLTRLMRDRGWYHLPDPAIAPAERQLLRPVTEPTPAAVSLQVQQKPDYIVVSSDRPGYVVRRNAGTYVIFKSDQHTYLMFANRHRPLYHRPWQVPPGFTAAMPTGMVQPGRYRLGLFRTHPDRSEIQFTNQFVDVP